MDQQALARSAECLRYARLTLNNISHQLFASTSKQTYLSVLDDFFMKYFHNYTACALIFMQLAAFGLVEIDLDEKGTQIVKIRPCTERLECNYSGTNLPINIFYIPEFVFRNTERVNHIIPSLIVSPDKPTLINLHRELYSLAKLYLDIVYTD